MTDTRPLAVVTGASSGIGLELARCAAQNGYDLVIAADEPAIAAAKTELERHGTHVEAVEADLSTTEGVDRLVAAAVAGGRPIDALFANAGRGLGDAFLKQDFATVKRVVDTNVTGTLYLLQKVGRLMQDRGEGRILVTGSVAGRMPGTFHAVYNGTKAMIDSFTIALRNELKDTGVTVTLLMPGATDTAFFETAGLEDTMMGQGPKDSAEKVARAGYAALMRGDAEVIPGLHNKMMTAMTSLTSDRVLAGQHRKMAAPGSGLPSQNGGGSGATVAFAVAAAVGIAALTIAGTQMNRDRSGWH